MSEELPPAIQETVSHLARYERGTEEAQSNRLRQRRARLLEKYGYASRIREDDNGAVLVCYPAEWTADGTIDREAIDDLERAVEIPLTGSGDSDAWEAVAEANRSTAEAVASQHGPVHGANARAFAAFMSNHRARLIRDATEDDLTEFFEEYYPRNVWPSDEEATVVESSVQYCRDQAVDADRL